MPTPSRTIVAAIILGLAVAGSCQAAAQSQEATNTTKKTFGYLDSREVFHAIPRATPDREAPTATYAGTLEVDVTITLLTQVAMGESVICEADFTASSIEHSTQSVTGYEETAIAPGKSSGKSWNLASSPSPEVTAATGTCKITIPYSWTLVPTGPGYTCSLVGDLSISLVTTNTTTHETTIWRTNQQAIPVTEFPDGGTTKYAVKVTL
jgi:hypothetical protein